MTTSNLAPVPLREAMLRAVEFHSKGDLFEAERWFQAILQAKPDHFESLHMLGVVAAQGGRFDEARERFLRALATNPQSAKAHNNLAAVLRAQGRRDEALASCDRALAIDSQFAEAHRNRAAILKDLGRRDEAWASCDRALAIRPGFAEALNIRGALAQDLQRYDQAIESYDRVVAIAPDFAEAWSNRGGALSALNRYADALASCDRALAAKPDLADAHYHRGLALSGLERHAEALANYDRALARNPDLAPALLSRAGALGFLRRYKEAGNDLERALALDPALDFAKGMLLQARLHLCDWRTLAEDTQQLVADVRAGRRAADPFVMLGVSDSPADQLQCARAWVDAWCRPAPEPLHRGTPYRHGRIRIAYLSADFREHAVAFLSAGLFERHDRTRFDVIGVSFGPDATGPMRERLVRAFERFIDVRQRSDDEIAALLLEHEVDIAVDLAGFTGGARTGIFARRAAPVQVNFLGYTATMGAPYYDYIVADPVAIPEEQREHYAESVVYLPDSFQVNDGQRRIAENTPTRADAGLPDGGFVFCSFNNSFKITPPVFERWMRLLRNVDGSVLWLMDGGADVVANLRREAQAQGIAPERLVFATKVPHEDHLARHRLADLFVDTLPFNAHTTASDALWAGLPVVTCAGTTFAGRVAASLLRAVGLPEMITHSLDEYEALALQLARDPSRLTAIRSRLAAQRSTFPLFDTDRFRRHLEAAYTQMWERHQAGAPPGGFAVPPETP
jgi:predicted O-linked N-acetylglucosamine transferase (SPINDLY family)